MDDSTLHLEKFYRCCEVYFKRTLTRIRRNAALVPPSQKMIFYNVVKCLLLPQTIDEFKIKVLNIIREYPRAKRWLLWHLKRGEFFPSMSNANLIELWTRKQYKNHWVLTFNVLLQKNSYQYLKQWTICTDILNKSKCITKWHRKAWLCATKSANTQREQQQLS